MADLIALLQIIQGLNQGGLATDQQVEHISEELLKTLQRTLNKNVWDALYGILNNNLNGNSIQGLFIDLI